MLFNLTIYISIRFVWIHSRGKMEMHVSSVIYYITLLHMFVGSTLGEEFSLNGYKIDVSGYDEIMMSRPDGKGVLLTVLGLYERDQHGNSISPSGHAVTLADVTAQNFTVDDPCAIPIPNSNVAGRLIAADAIVDTGTSTSSGGFVMRIGYEVYFVTNSGAVILNTGVDKELQRIYVNNIKMTWALDGWRWCAPCDGNNGESMTGAFLDVVLRLQLPSGAVVKKENVINGPQELSLGNRMTLYLSNQVKRDSVWQRMPLNFLHVSDEDPSRPNSYNVTIRLPKFDDRIVYDPVFSLDGDDTTFHEDSDEPSKVQCRNDQVGDQDDPPVGAGVSSTHNFFRLIVLLSLLMALWNV